jgi:hypothetical protein
VPWAWNGAVNHSPKNSADALFLDAHPPDQQEHADGHAHRGVDIGGGDHAQVLDAEQLGPRPGSNRRAGCP